MRGDRADVEHVRPLHLAASTSEKLVCVERRAVPPAMPARRLLTAKTMSASDRPVLDSLPSADAALRRLRDGNRRFVENVRSVDSLLSQAARRSLVLAQVPIAIVLSCSDSRAPAELVFDQGLGDLFVVRVAGNIVAPALVGSVEFAAVNFGTELVIVMGHSHCGVIAATVDGIAPRNASSNLSDIVDRIRPAIADVLQPHLGNAAIDRAVLLAAATRANVRASAAQLRSCSELLRERIAAGHLTVVGAEYSLETGEVDFFDGVPR